MNGAELYALPINTRIRRGDVEGTIFSRVAAHTVKKWPNASGYTCVHWDNAPDEVWEPFFETETSDWHFTIVGGAR